MLFINFLFYESSFNNNLTCYYMYDHWLYAWYNKEEVLKKIYTRLSHWNMTYFLVIRSLSKNNLKCVVIIFSKILRWQIICKVVCPKFQLSINYLQWTILQGRYLQLADITSIFCVVRCVFYVLLSRKFFTQD